MGSIDTGKLALAILISFISCMPLAAWVFLAGTGRLGGFADAQSHHDLTAAIFIATAVWSVGVVPFVIWPRLFNGSVSRRNLLKKGIPARAILLERGLEGRDVTVPRKGRHTNLVMSLRVILPDGEYEIGSHLALVPGNILPFVRKGMEFPVRVSTTDRTMIEIEWERLLAHYPDMAADGAGGPPEPI